MASQRKKIISCSFSIKSRPTVSDFCIGFLVTYLVCLLLWKYTLKFGSGESLFPSRSLCLGLVSLSHSIKNWRPERLKWRERFPSEAKWIWRQRHNVPSFSPAGKKHWMAQGKWKKKKQPPPKTPNIFLHFGTLTMFAFLHLSFAWKDNCHFPSCVASPPFAQGTS